MRTPPSDPSGPLEDLIEGQRRKLFDLARRIDPAATPEDVLNPQDSPALREDPLFNYEEGVLAGLLAARAALRAGPPAAGGRRPRGGGGRAG